MKKKKDGEELLLVIYLAVVRVAVAQETQLDLSQVLDWALVEGLLLHLISVWHDRLDLPQLRWRVYLDPRPVLKQQMAIVPQGL